MCFSTNVFLAVFAIAYLAAPWVGRALLSVLVRVRRRFPAAAPMARQAGA